MKASECRGTVILFLTPEQAKALQRLIIADLEDWKFICADAGAGSDSVAHVPTHIHHAMIEARLPDRWRH